MMKATRRQILRAAVGASQLALLGKFGLLPIQSKRAYAAAAAANGPTRLLTIFCNGGWIPWYFFCPLDATTVSTFVPPMTVAGGEPLYYDAAQVRNLDASGDDRDAVD